MSIAVAVVQYLDCIHCNNYIKTFFHNMLKLSFLYSHLLMFCAIQISGRGYMNYRTSFQSEKYFLFNFTEKNGTNACTNNLTGVVVA